MRSKGFEGWYFKHQCGGETVAFIPGRAQSGAFVQVVTNEESWQFPVPDVTEEDGEIRAGSCVFGPGSAVIRLPGIRGELTYGPFQRLQSDIMGPFRFFPMECRHGVISMGHSLAGGLTLEEREISFDGGRGYIEMDSGRSFPQSYLWMQCNNFAEPLSVMLSIARIPFGGLRFTGCICAVVYRGREYRLATYDGVRILTSEPHHIVLAQGKLRLEVEVTRADFGRALAAPVLGRMSGVIRECNKARARFRLWERGNLLFDQTSDHVSYECVPAGPPVNSQKKESCANP
jgi:tocopherol cyclase